MGLDHCGLKFIVRLNSATRDQAVPFSKSFHKKLIDHGQVTIFPVVSESGARTADPQSSESAKGTAPILIDVERNGDVHQILADHITELANEFGDDTIFGGSCQVVAILVAAKSGEAFLDPQIIVEKVDPRHKHA